MCKRAVKQHSWCLECILEWLKTVDMCQQAIGGNPLCLEYIPYHLKTQEMCDETVDIEPHSLEFVSDQYKAGGMCERVIEKKSWLLKYFPDWFVTQQQIKLRHDDAYYYCNDNYLICYDGYKKQKAQKASIKEELLPIAWHPSRLVCS